jgi:hypothetical protein
VATPFGVVRVEHKVAEDGVVESEMDLPEGIELAD